MKVIVTAPRPNPKTRPPTSNASPIFVGRSAASDWARSWSLSPRSVRASICWKRSEARMRDTIVGSGSTVVNSMLTDSLIGDAAVVEGVRGQINVSDHSVVRVRA